MTRMIFAVAVSALLTACTTAVDTLEQGLPLFKGKKIEYAINYWGYPDSEVNVGDKKIYMWKDSSVYTDTISTRKPQYTTSYGRFGQSFTSYTMVEDETPITISSHCNISLVTINGKIVDTKLDGIGGACTKYAKKIEPLVEAQEKKLEASKNAVSKKGG